MTTITISYDTSSNSDTGNAGWVASLETELEGARYTETISLDVRPCRGCALRDSGESHPLPRPEQRATALAQHHPSGIAEDLQQSLREAFGDDIANFYKIRVVNGDKPGHVMVEVRKKETL